MKCLINLSDKPHLNSQIAPLADVHIIFVLASLSPCAISVFVTADCLGERDCFD